MKRVGNLWEQVITFENLLLAAKKAQRGKRFRPNVLEFNDNLRRGRNRLRKLQEGFRNGSVSLEQLIQCLQSWESHLKQADSYRLRQSLFERWQF